MFYHVAKSGTPTQFGSFDDYLQMLIKSKEGVYEITGIHPYVPKRTDFHASDIPAPHGFDSRPLRIWYRNGIFIGYEF